MAVRDDPNLAWLAGAVCGRALAVNISSSLAAAYTDGVAIHLPESLPRESQRHAVIAQALLLTSGSFQRELILALRLRPGAVPRYFGLELQRAVHTHAERVPHAFLQAHAALRASPRSTTAAQSLALAIAGHSVEVAAVLGTIRPFRWGADEFEAAQVAAQAARPAAAQDVAAADSEALNEAQRELLDRFKTPLTRGLGFADTLLRLMGFQRSAGRVVNADADGSAPLAATAASAGIEGRSQQHVGARTRVDAPASAGGLVLPEWDYRQARYRANHVRIREILPLPMADTVAAPSQPLPLPGLTAALNRIGAEHEHAHAQASGTDLDLDALIDLKLDHRAGYSAHENIYVSLRPTRRDLAVLILLDISRSTADADAQGITVLTQHREMGARLARVFARLGDRVAFCAFHSWGAQGVRIVHLKRFDEPAAVLDERLRALAPAGLTRMGAAVRYGTQLLARDRHRTHKLMVMLTDGFAYDDGYEGQYARADMQRALAESAVAGVASVCIQVGSNQQDEVLRDLYGDAAYLCCRRPREFVGPFKRLAQAALHRASLAKFGGLHPSARRPREPVAASARTTV